MFYLCLNTWIHCKYIVHTSYIFACRHNGCMKFFVNITLEDCLRLYCVLPGIDSFLFPPSTHQQPLLSAQWIQGKQFFPQVKEGSCFVNLCGIRSWHPQSPDGGSLDSTWASMTFRVAADRAISHSKLNSSRSSNNDIFESSVKRNWTLFLANWV